MTSRGPPSSYGRVGRLIRLTRRPSSRSRRTSNCPRMSGISLTPTSADWTATNGRRAEPGRIAELGVSGFDRQPREHRERKIAVEFQIAPGAIAHRLRDVVLVVIRIDERDHRDTGKHQ